MDPLAGTPWSQPSTVDGFVRGEPNPVLMEYAATLARERPGGVLVDIGCGAARNALPLGRLGWRVLGTDLSRPMLDAARQRVQAEPSTTTRVAFALAPMQALPCRTGSADFIVAHGIWNLAGSDALFRSAVGEAARIAMPGAALFVFTFSRHTLPDDAQPLPGQTLTFTQFAGRPQIFLTETQLVDELARAGFVRDNRVPLTEYNRPESRALRTTGGPVIYEAAFRFQGPGE
ncbi:MAG: class I SAM-dependent methyltransferase [Vicinamibacterales bacterium]